MSNIVYGYLIDDSYYLENIGPKSCHLSVKSAYRIDKYRVDESITMMIGIVLTYFVRSNDEDCCMILYNFQEKPPTVKS